MNIEDAKKHLRPGVAIQYAPSIVPGRETRWFNGVVDSWPRRLGGGDEGIMVVHLREMEPAYDAETGHRGRADVTAASVQHVRIKP